MTENEKIARYIINQCISNGYGINEFNTENIILTDSECRSMALNFPFSYNVIRKTFSSPSRYSYSFSELIKNTSLPEETQDNWADWVCEPIIKFILAPRYAKLILMICGEMLNSGISIQSIIKKLQG